MPSPTKDSFHLGQGFTGSSSDRQPRRHQTMQSIEAKLNSGSESDFSASDSGNNTHYHSSPIRGSALRNSVYGSTGQEETQSTVQSEHSMSSSSHIQVPEPSFKQRVQYYIPCSSWMRSYSLESLLHDMVAGLSLASYQIPLSMSFATAVAHVPPLCGLLSLAISPVVYMILGTVPHMIVGPEAAVSMIAGQCIEKAVRHNPDVSPVDLLVVLSSCSGAILLSFGLFRFGFIDNVLCSSLMKAFITSIGVTMMTNSAISILGLDSVLGALPPEVHVHSPFQKLVFLVQNLGQYSRPSAVVGVSTFVVLYILKQLKAMCAKRVKGASFFPEILVVVVFATVLSGIFDFEHHGLDVLGKVTIKGFKMKLPFSRPLLHWYSDLFPAAFACGILGFFETSTAGKSLPASSMPMSSNRELVALGASSLTVSAFSGLPAFGGYARSKLNATNGAKTPVSGAFMGLTTLIVTLYMLDYIYYLPICVLNAVIAIVGLSLLKEAPGELLFHIRTRGYNEIITFFITLGCGIFYSIELGVTFGTFYSLMRVIKHSTQSRIQIMARVAGTDTFVNSDFVNPAPLLSAKIIVKGYTEFRRKSAMENQLAHDRQGGHESPDETRPLFPELEDREGCLIIKIPEPLTFTNASDLKMRLKKVELYGSGSAHPGIKQKDEELRHIVFDLHGMTSLDSSATQILLQIVNGYISRGITVFFCRVYRSRKLLERLEKCGLKGLLEEHQVFNSAIPRLIWPYYDRTLDALKAIDYMECSDHIDVLSPCSSTVPYDGSV